MGIGSPRLRRQLAAAATLALVFAGTGHAVSVTPLERSFLDRVNAARTARGVAPVRLDATLELGARRHTAAMLARGAMSHGSWWHRLRLLGARGPWLGEDLGWYSDPTAAPQAIVRMWLASAEHRAVLLRGGFHLVGIGAAIGPFMGFDRAVVVTADFEGT
jgi:uncharacterized protein YkwD